ncbi:PAS domain-containing protein [Pseudomonas hefeiensis]|uniref:PAS domain-containing protein n=1 Tax=Pseudomonas hefeiensis TaxID=2738125 RepID=UPI003BF4A165
MAVVEFSPDGKVLRANENFLHTMGHRADQLAGMSHRDFCTPALVSSAEYRQFWDRLRAGQFVSGTFQRVNGKGGNVWLEAQL